MIQSHIVDVIAVRLAVESTTSPQYPLCEHSICMPWYRGLRIVWDMQGHGFPSPHPELLFEFRPGGPGLMNRLVGRQQ